MVRVSRDANLVDHSRDQEHPPASRRLRTAQLCLQIWHNPGLGRRRSTAPIGYAHHEVLILDEDHNLYGHLRSVLVAVFHGVHGRFGHRCLEPLQILPPYFQFSYCLSYPLHRHTLVAWLTWHRKLCQHAPPQMSVRARVEVAHALSDLSSVTRVISSSCSQSAPVKRASSESRKLTIAGPSDRYAPTSPCKRGKPNISRSGSCASTSPSL